jgi:hypothetical protein
LRIEEVITAPHSPWQNAYAERVIGSIRRECLDHVIVVSEEHLRRILKEYFRYYHNSRRIRHSRGTRHFHERSKRRRKARSSQSLKLAGCIIAIDEPHNVGVLVSSGVISIKSMEGLSVRAEINVRCCKATRRRPDYESSIRRRDQRRIIRELALHRQGGIFGTDRRRRRRGLSARVNGGAQNNVVRGTKPPLSSPWASKGNTIMIQERPQADLFK